MGTTTVLRTALLVIVLLTVATTRSVYADGDGQRAIYCGGVRGAIVYSRLEAVCWSNHHRRFYHLVLHGAGASVILSGTVFKLVVNFPADRYDANFDPVPGEYFASVKGFAPGYSELNGSAGNKAVHAYAYNGGAGLDRTLAAYLRIAPLSGKDLAKYIPR